MPELTKAQSRRLTLLAEKGRQSPGKESEIKLFEALVEKGLATSFWNDQTYASYRVFEITEAGKVAANA